MKIYQASLIALLLCLSSSCDAAQSALDCSPTNSALIENLSENKEFAEYVCPSEQSLCSKVEFPRLLEFKQLSLRSKNASHGESDACLVVPIRKGTQFPSIVYALIRDQIKPILEDWESGLKVLPETRNGWFVIEGRSMPSRERLEKYRFEWRSCEYVEFDRDCFTISPEYPSSLKQIGCMNNP